jgi:hypothetical protein
LILSADNWEKRRPGALIAVPVYLSHLWSFLSNIPSKCNVDEVLLGEKWWNSLWTMMTEVGSSSQEIELH